MSDALKPGNGALPLDPANPNAGHVPIPYWRISIEDMNRIQSIAINVAAYFNAHKLASTKPLDALLVAMDLASIHCTNSPQDFRQWMSAGISEAVAEYAIVFANIDRTCGMLPDYAKMRWRLRQ